MLPRGKTVRGKGAPGARVTVVDVGKGWKLLRVVDVTVLGCLSMVLRI